MFTGAPGTAVIGPKRDEVADADAEDWRRLERVATRRRFSPGEVLVREGEIDAALTTLEYVHREGERQFIDPPLYRGALLYRLGRHAEALRDLADAHRLDPGCPLVH